MVYLNLARFISSTIPFSLNTFKSIFFRLSSILLQFTIYKIFSFVAFRNDFFTSYLIFDEGPYQKLLYIYSRGFNRQSFIVLTFSVFFGVAALWDTLLWGLDTPGWIVQPRRVTAGKLIDKMRADPAYVVLSRSDSGVGALDLQHDLGEGLWDGVNVTLAGVVDIGTPQVSRIMNYSEPDFQLGPGPRIWLDDEGWSVNLDFLLSNTASFGCPVGYQGVNIATWGCEYDLYRGLGNGLDFLAGGFGKPGFWWQAGGGVADMDEMPTERGVNPWGVLGKGGDSVIMKEVFTLTKGTTRHVFLLTAWKATMLAFQNTPISMQEIQDLVDRTWQEGRDISEKAELLNAITSAFNSDKGITTGKQTATGYEVNSRAYQYLKTVNVISNETEYSAFQILDSNVTLIRTETVPSPPVPFGKCDSGYHNEANGGKVRRSTCKYYNLPAGNDGNFLGQVDTSTVLILQDILGSRRAEASSTALNESAWRWLQTNNNNIDNLVLSRGYILGVSPEAVTINLNNITPAISLLQLVFIAVPFVAAAMAYILVCARATFHYQASLFSNLVATTHMGYDCEKPESMNNPPEIGIMRRDDRVYLGTQGGGVWYMTGEVPGRPLVGYTGGGTAPEVCPVMGDKTMGY